MIHVTCKPETETPLRVQASVLVQLFGFAFAVSLAVFAVSVISLIALQ
jgi:hypothetical protein